MLLKRGFKVKFTVVGNIDNNQEYQKLKKHDFVTYIQHCPKEKLIQLYRKNDIFVMPSKTETFGLVYAEAMSQGLPVIYTRGQGFDGQFPEGEVGYSVPYDSPAKIAKRVRDIINRYDTISNNCINKVGKFNWDKIAKSYLRVYRGCMDKQEGEQQ